MSFNVNYLPPSNEVGGLQSFGALTVFENLNLGYTGITGSTGPTGVTGPLGATGTFSNTFPSGDILYSNGDTTVGTTGGLFWNQYTQTMITSNASANTYTLGSNGNLFPPPPAPVTIPIGPYSLTGFNSTGQIIYQTNITSPNYGTTWGIEVNYNLLMTSTNSVSLNGPFTSFWLSYTGQNPLASAFAGSSIPITSNFGINGSEIYSLVLSPNTTITLYFYGYTNEPLHPVLVNPTSSLNSNITSYLTYRFYQIN